MNKIYTILLLSLTLFVAGCSDDDDDMVVQNLKVIESQTEYPSLGGTGTIEVSSVGAFTATSSETWCKPSVSGNIITVTVGQNTDIEGRHARIEIASGDEKLYVAVTQLGTTFIIGDKITLPLVADSGDLPFSTENAIEVEIDPADDWISYNLKTDTLTIITKKATAPRSAVIKVKSGTLTKEVTVNQDFGYKDFLGNYTFSFVMASMGQRVSVNGALYQNDEKENSYILFPIIMPDGSGSAIEVTYNPTTRNIIANSNQYLGEVTLANGSLVYAFTTGKSTDNYWTTAVVQYEGVFTVANNKPVFTFADNGSWTNKVLNGFYIRAFSQSSVSSDYNLGAFDNYTDWVLTKQ